MTASFTRIAPRVWTTTIRGVAPLNIGLIAGSRIAVLVDPGPAGDDHAGLLTAVREILETEAPRAELRVVNTHGHDDHTGANQYLVERGVEVVYAHEAARVVSATDLIGNEPLRLDAGGVEIVIEHLGRGHTAGDIVVGALPERDEDTPAEGVLFCGDLVREGTDPSFRDSYPQDWLRALGAIATMGGRYPTVVPGHGELVDSEFVLAMRRRMVQGHRISSQAIRDSDHDATKAIPIVPYGPVRSRELITRLRGL